MSLMSSPTELVAIELTDDERDFVEQTLEQWSSSAASRPFPFQVLGLSTWEEFGALTYRLERAAVDGAALTDLDWARLLFLTEVTFASALIGSGTRFTAMTRFSDAQAINVLRGLQRKISNHHRAALLFPDGGRTRTAEQIERWRYMKVKEFDERFDAGQDMAAALVMGTLHEPCGVGGEPYDEFDVKSD
jgi:hypothetical protein